MKRLVSSLIVVCALVTGCGNSSTLKEKEEPTEVSQTIEQEVTETSIPTQDEETRKDLQKEIMNEYYTNGYESAVKMAEEKMTYKAAMEMLGILEDLEYGLENPNGDGDYEPSQEELTEEESFGVKADDYSDEVESADDEPAVVSGPLEIVHLNFDTLPQFYKCISLASYEYEQVAHGKYRYVIGLSLNDTSYRPRTIRYTLKGCDANNKCLFSVESMLMYKTAEGARNIDIDDMIMVSSKKPCAFDDTDIVYVVADVPMKLELAHTYGIVTGCSLVE